MDEYIKSIKAHLYDRATSPLFGTFAASWIAWNYKFFVVLASSMDADEKLAYIPTVLYASYWDRLGSGLLLPLLTTIFFIFVYPHAAKPVFRYVRQEQKKLREIKREIEDEILLSVKESRALKRAALAQEEKFNTVIHQREDEIQQLKEIIAGLEDQVRNPTIVQSIDVSDEPHLQTDQTKSGDQKLDPKQLEMLIFIAKNPMLPDKRIFSFAGGARERIEAEYNLGELLRRSLVERAGIDSQNNNAPLYSATHAGREFLVKRRENDVSTTANHSSVAGKDYFGANHQEHSRIVSDLNDHMRVATSEWNDAKNDNDVNAGKAALKWIGNKLKGYRNVFEIRSSVVSEPDDILRRLDDIQHLRVENDGRSFRNFWDLGDGIIADIASAMLLIQQATADRP